MCKHTEYHTVMQLMLCVWSVLDGCESVHLSIFCSFGCHVRQ